MRPGDYDRRGPYPRGPPFAGRGGGGLPFRGNDFRDGPAPDGFMPRGGPPAGIGAGIGPGGQPPAPQFVVDRTKTCPLLLRVFVKLGSHHRIEDFNRGKVGLLGPPVYDAT